MQNICGGKAVAVDRLGSIRARAEWQVYTAVWVERHKYYPYGEERETTISNREKFATYHRDQSTNLDYALNRYYGWPSGRFTTPDPFSGNTKSVNNPAEPKSWNRYVYVHGDPVNFNDPKGMCLSPDGDSADCEETAPDIASPIERALAMLFTPAASGGVSVPNWNQAMTDCHLRNLAYMSRYGVMPTNPEYGDNGGIRWKLSEKEAAALAALLINQGFSVSHTTGAMHNDDVGKPNTDYRSFTAATNDRSVQIVIGPPDENGIVRVYADTDRYNPHQGAAGSLGHAFVEVLPGIFGFNTSCW